MKTQSPEKKAPSFLFWILLVAFLVRMSLALVALKYPERAYGDDTASYMDFAHAILNGHGWDYPSAFRPPIYPVFLAGLMALFGEQTFPLVLVQVLISTINIGCTYWLAQKIFDNNTAAIAATLLVFNAETIAYSFYLLSETLFTFFFILIACFLLQTHNKDNWKMSILAGLCIGVSILTRPLGVYYPLLVLALLLFDQTPLKIRLRNAFVFLLACGSVVIPWIVRNSVVLDLPTISSTTEYNLIRYAVPLLGTDGDNDAYNKLQDRIEQTLAERGLPDNETNRTRISGELGRQIILGDPLNFAIIHLKGNLGGFNPDNNLSKIFEINIEQSTISVLRNQGVSAAISKLQNDYDDKIWVIIISWLLRLVLVICYLGWGVATIFMLVKKQFYTLIFLSFPIYYSMLLPGILSYARFRVPAMPFICILAGAGLVLIAKYYKQWRIKPFANILSN